MKHKSSEIDLGGMAGIDTKFVLFFLALEYGRAFDAFSIEGLFMAITMIMVMVLPYYLPSFFERPPFGGWLMNRAMFGIVGVAIGAALTRSIGVVLPESAQFMPMTFLIMASMVSCYFQFYCLMRLRPAK